MTRESAVRRYLTEQGVRPDLVEGGLPGLVERWEQIVEHVAQGYELTIDDYRNDMDIRGLIEGAIDTAGPGMAHGLQARLSAADERLKEVTDPSSSVWGDDPLDDQAHWWYFRRPRNPGPSLREDLR